MKDLIWVASSLKDIRAFPDDVKAEFGYALYQIQLGKVPVNAKVLKGFKPAVFELVSNYKTDTYRVCNTIKLKEFIYVLHCFQKKSHKGKKTPSVDLNLIKERLKVAKEINLSEEVLV